MENKLSDKKILKISTSFRKGLIGKQNPKGLCFTTCLALQGYLHMIGVDLEMKECDIEKYDEIWHHFYLLLPSGNIIDPTASQFSKPDLTPMPEIYYGEKPHWYLPCSPISTDFTLALNTLTHAK